MIAHDEYQRLLLGSFEYSKDEEWLRKLAWEYHDRTEAYDQIACTGRLGKVSVPMSGRELGDINRNAVATLKEICRREGREGCPEFMGTLRKAIQRTAHEFEQHYQLR